MTEPAYVVKKNENGCSSCGHGATWDVVGPDEVAFSMSFGDEDRAQEFADDLCTAFSEGLALGRADADTALRAENARLREGAQGVLDSMCRTPVGAGDGGTCVVTSPSHAAVARLAEPVGEQQAFSAKVPSKAP